MNILYWGTRTKHVLYELYLLGYFRAQVMWAAAAVQARRRCIVALGALAGAGLVAAFMETGVG